VERADPVPDRPFWVEWPVRAAGTPEALAKGPAVLRIHDLTDELDATLTARGRSPRNGPDLRYWLRVRKGANLESQFVSVLEPYGKSPFIKSIRRLPLAEQPDGFAVALEVRLADGRTDRIFATENGGRVATPDGFALDGRLGWVRFDADGGFLEASLIDAGILETPGRRIEASGPAALTGTIVEIRTDEDHTVHLKLSGDKLPESLVGRTIIVDNHTRSDASYRIEAVEPGGWISIGRAAIGERHLDPEDYSKGIEATIRPGESYRIASGYHIKG